MRRIRAAAGSDEQGPETSGYGWVIIATLAITETISSRVPCYAFASWTLVDETVRSSRGSWNAPRWTRAARPLMPRRRAGPIRAGRARPAAVT